MGGPDGTGFAGGIGGAGDGGTRGNSGGSAAAAEVVAGQRIPPPAGPAAGSAVSPPLACWCCILHTVILQRLSNAQTR